MPKNKLKTPEWILQGYDSSEEYAKAKGKKENKKSGHPRAYTQRAREPAKAGPETFSKKGLQEAKTFKIKECPKCGSYEVRVILAGEGKKADNWECRKCNWEGRNIKEKELTEEEFMKYMDKKEEVA